MNNDYPELEYPTSGLGLPPEFKKIDAGAHAPDATLSSVDVSNVYNEHYKEQLIRVGIPVSEELREAQNNALSETEREELFAGLRTSLQKKENDTNAPAMSVIETALMKNPILMRNMWKLQQAGAELVVVNFQQGDQYIEFVDGALNLDIRKQEEALAGLSEKEKNGAIEKILAPITDDAQRASAKAWLLPQLSRLDGVQGLNYVEALVYAVAHGGTLITHDAYDVIAKKDPSIYEDKTWTWYFKVLHDVMRSGGAPYGRRDGGEANYREYGAGGRNVNLGVRVTGLRVLIA